MRFVAELQGEASILKSLAPYFQSAHVRLRQTNHGWLLESSEFDHCKTRDEVFSAIDRVLCHIHGLLYIYLGLSDALSVKTFLSVDSMGRPFRRSLRETIRLRVWSKQAIPELMRVTSNEPLGSALIRQAETNTALREALTLVANRERGWNQVYDVIEFLGGVRRIAKEGWATKARADKVRRTANHYRHLGSPRKNTLPPKPPTLTEALNFSRDLMKRWIRTQIQ